MNKKRGSNRQRGGASVQEGSFMKLFQRLKIIRTSLSSWTLLYSEDTLRVERKQNRQPGYELIYILLKSNNSQNTAHRTETVSMITKTVDISS